MPIKKKCSSCGKVRYLKTTIITKTETKHICDTCLETKVWRYKQVFINPGDRVTECKWCGKEFERTNKYHEFHTITCRRAYRTQKRRLKKDGKLVNTKVHARVCQATKKTTSLTETA